MEDLSAFERSFEVIEQALQTGTDLEFVVDFMTKFGGARSKSGIETADMKAVDYAREHNLDVLTSNTTGKRTIAELEASRPFWLGLASQCVAVGVVNARVGIAGAHFLSATEKDVKNGWRKLLTSGKEKALEEVKRVKAGGHAYLMESLVPVSHRVQRLVAAIEAASDLYNELEQEIKVKSQPWVCITGLNYGTDKDRRTLSYYAEKTLKRTLRNPIMDLRIGLAGGVVYGGPRSAFPKPKIIT